MEISRSLGNTSSSLLSPDEAIARLRLLADSEAVKSITSLLGPDSELCIVGGTVRDIFAGIEDGDIDLACKYPPEITRSKLKRGAIGTYETGIAHGTITAVVNKQNIEITTFRKPGHRSSSVYSQTIEEDLSGRDFTINAIAYQLFNGSLVDPFDGLGDLKATTLRCVGDAMTRFDEDPLRILRMVRFGPAQRRTIESTALVAARAARSLLRGVSAERIRAELEKILLSCAAGDGIRSLKELQLLEYVVPELLAAVDFEQNRFHTEDVFEHTLSVIDNAPPTLRLRLAALFHDTGKPHTLSIDENGDRHFYNHEKVSYEFAKQAMKRLRFSNDEIDAVSTLVRLHMRPMDCGPSGLRRLMRDLGEYFDEWVQLKEADVPPTMPRSEFDQRLVQFEKMIADEKERLAKSGGSNLAIDGNDLIALGVSPGPFLGKILKALENEIIENPNSNDREILLKMARELIASAPSA